MKEVTTYVGIDAHKKDLFVAMLIGTATTPVTWQLANEAAAERRCRPSTKHANSGLIFDAAAVAPKQAQ